jgi:hypothetical protein
MTCKSRYRPLLKASALAKSLRRYGDRKRRCNGVQTVA